MLQKYILDCKSFCLLQVRPFFKGIAYFIISILMLEMNSLKQRLENLLFNLCWIAVKCGTSLYVEQLSVIFNGVNALQNWKDPQNTMYTFFKSMPTHMCTHVHMWDGVPYVFVRCKSWHQHENSHFWFPCTLRCTGWESLFKYEVIFSLMFISLKAILSTCAPVFCVVLCGVTGCRLLSEIKIK